MTVLNYARYLQRPKGVVIRGGKAHRAGGRTLDYIASRFNMEAVPRYIYDVPWTHVSVGKLLRGEATRMANVEFDVDPAVLRRARELGFTDLL